MTKVMEVELKVDVAESGTLRHGLLPEGGMNCRRASDRSQLTTPQTRSAACAVTLSDAMQVQA